MGEFETAMTYSVKEIFYTLKVKARRQAVPRCFVGSPDAICGQVARSTE